MTAIPENTVTPELMVQWNDLQQKLAKIKAEEMILRTAIYKHFFKDPKEGTNTAALHAGWELKATRTIDRKIELPTFQAMAVENGPFHLAGIRAADYIEWEPKLKIANYRTLTAEQKLVFDQALVIKDGSPQLKIVLPAKIAKQQAAQ